jgi:hypothetical protein
MAHSLLATNTRYSVISKFHGLLYQLNVSFIIESHCIPFSHPAFNKEYTQKTGEYWDIDIDVGNIPLYICTMEEGS